MNRRVRMGVVGLGQWGRHHARILAHLPGVDLVGIADVNGREAAHLAHRYGTRPLRDHHDLLGQVEAVTIAVPTALHFAIARDFLEAGAHVLVEKPMTVTAEEAGRLSDLAARRERVLLVGHIERFKPAVQRLFRLVGEPLSIEARRMRPYDPGRTMDTGVVMDLMIHDIDIVDSMVPGRFDDLQAIGVCVHNSHEDLAMARLRMDTGCLVTLTASRVAARKTAEMEVTMADRAVHLDLLRQTIAINFFNGETQRITLEGEEPLELELRHFVECVRSGSRPLVSGEDGRRSLEITEALLSRMVRITPPVRV
ncbi:MAG: Gfo/Idh/MocA family oxidoreductase [Armatimonadetes bacterium]|nr:Gfo/Idh/MocA family oxidoreductase [Armatimonadota bacterium]